MRCGIKVCDTISKPSSNLKTSMEESNQSSMQPFDAACFQAVGHRAKQNTHIIQTNPSILDFFTLYANLPHNFIKKKFKYLVKWCFDKSKSNYICSRLQISQISKIFLNSFTYTNIFWKNFIVHQDFYCKWDITSKILWLCQE